MDNFNNTYDIFKKYHSPKPRKKKPLPMNKIFIKDSRLSPKKKYIDILKSKKKKK